MSDEQTDKKLIAALEDLLEAQKKMLKDNERRFKTAMELLNDAVTNAQLRCLFFEDAMDMSNEEASAAFEEWQEQHGMDNLLARCAERDEDEEEIEDTAEKAWTADEIWKSLGEESA